MLLFGNEHHHVTVILRLTWTFAVTLSLRDSLTGCWLPITLSLHKLWTTCLDTNYEHRFDPKEQAEPHSHVLEPVYDSLTENRTVVAFLSAFVHWVFFMDFLPEHEQGIHVVLESTCDEVFTYEIFGHKAAFIGEGNLHDTSFELGELKEEFKFAPFLALELDEGEHRFLPLLCPHLSIQAMERSIFYIQASDLFCCSRFMFPDHNPVFPLL